MLAGSAAIASGGAGLAAAAGERAETPPTVIAQHALQDLANLGVPYRNSFGGGDGTSIAWLNGPTLFAIDPGYLISERRLRQTTANRGGSAQLFPDYCAGCSFALT